MPQVVKGDAPYEAAQAWLAVARVCLRWVTATPPNWSWPPAAGGLSPRELEVLRRVATGASNRQIADTLVISEKTVARHLANILHQAGRPVPVSRHRLRLPARPDVAGYTEMPMPPAGEVG